MQKSRQEYTNLRCIPDQIFWPTLSQQDMSRPTGKSIAVAWALAKKALHAPPNYHAWNFKFYFL